MRDRDCAFLQCCQKRLTLFGGFDRIQLEIRDTPKEIFTVIKGVARMVIKETVINNQVGLHARPATFFIQKANEFKCSIWIEKDERRVNAKSLLGVLSLGIIKGTAINIIADGPDENQAIEILSALISSDFSE